jgi:membrane associated rhomboid family serine protease
MASSSLSVGIMRRVSEKVFWGMSLLVSRITGLVLSAMRATNVLILVCIVATLYALTTTPTNVDRNLVFSLKNMQEGRVWTLVTAIFVHASLLHLLGNMVFLYVFGNTLESVTDSKKMLTVFFVGGAT